MKNFDEPEGAAPGDELPRGQRVEIVGDPARLAEAFRVDTSLRGLNEDVLRRISESTSASLGARGLHDAGVKAAMDKLRLSAMPKIDLPTAFRTRIDTSEFVTTRVTPREIKLPKPVRSIVDIRLEALGERLEVVAVALTRLIDVAEVQRDATLASHSAAEGRHARSEALADQRAERAHNLAAWSATFAAVAAIVVVIQFFFG